MIPAIGLITAGMAKMAVRMFTGVATSEGRAGLVSGLSGALPIIGCGSGSPSGPRPSPAAS
jgi:hypothetical protein